MGELWGISGRGKLSDDWSGGLFDFGAEIATLLAAPPEDDGGGDEDGAIGADDDPDEDGESEVVEDWAAEEVEGGDGEQSATGDEEGPGECLVDGGVHDGLDRAFSSVFEAFADAIINDDGVIDGVASDGEDGADHDEGEFATEDGEDAHGDDDIVEEGDDGADGEAHFEANGDIGKDAEHAEAEGPEGGLEEFAADDIADFVFGFLFEARLGHFFEKGLLDLFCGIDGAPKADEIGFGGGVAFLLDDEVGEIERGEFRADLGDFDGLGIFEEEEIAAFEVDAEVMGVAGDETDRADNGCGQRDADPEFTAAHEIDSLAGDEVEHGDALDEIEAKDPGEDHPSDDHGGEDGGDDAEDQGDGEAFDGATGLPEEDHRGD